MVTRQPKQARSKYEHLMAKCHGLASVRTAVAHLVLGARVPIVSTSRADSVRARLASCAVGMLLTHARRPGAASGARGGA